MSQYFFWCALDQGYLSLNPKAPPPHLGFTSMLVSCFIWGSYGLSMGSPSMWIPNATGFIVATITVSALHAADPLDTNVLLVMAAFSGTVAFLQAAGGVVGLDKATANTITGYIGNVVGIVMLCSGAQAWPQIIETSDASALEAQTGMLLAGFSNAMAWAALGMIKLKDPLVWVPNLLGVFCNLACFGFLFKFGSGGWDQTIAAVIGVHVVVYAVLVQSFEPVVVPTKAD